MIGTQHKLTLIAGLTILSLVASTASAGSQGKFSFLGGGGVWLHPELGGHGIGLVAYDLHGLVRSSHLGVELNTDTIRLSFDRLQIQRNRLEIGAAITGEVMFAGLLPDYYQDGKLDKSRGFWASYAHAQVYLKMHLPGSSFLSFWLAGRRWFFEKTKDTQSDFVLPAETWVFEPRLRYTLWALQPDRSNWEKNRLFGRIRGISAGFNLGLDLRSDTRPWGARDLSSNLTDTRNDPEAVIFVGELWLRAGWQLHDRIRTQFSEFAGVGSGGDDLSRRRIGGLNPYVIPLAGAPWAAFLAERYIAAQWSWHFRVAGELETGVLFDGVFLEDGARTGNMEDWDTLGGLGLFLDWPIGRWQIDIRTGWCPSLDSYSDIGQFSVFASAGFTG